MLFIDNETVSQVLKISDTIDSLDKAFRGLVDGGSIHRPRIDVYVPPVARMTITAGAPWKAQAATLACSPFA